MTHRILYFGFFLLTAQAFASYYVADERFQPVFRFSTTIDNHQKLSEAAGKLTEEQLQTICSHAHYLFTADMRAEHIYFILKALQPLDVKAIKDFAILLPNFYTANMIGEGYARIAQAIKKIPEADRVDTLVMVHGFPNVYDKGGQVHPLNGIHQARAIERLIPRASSNE